MVSYRKEIPSSLDLLPLGERFGDKNQARMRARPSAKFSHIRSSIDHGKKEKKSSELKAEQRLTRRKGENFGRIAPQTLVKYIKDGQDAFQLSQKLDDIQILRTGKFPTKRPPAETTMPKIVLLDLRSSQDFNKSHIQNALSFPAENIQRDQVFAQLSVHKNKPDKLLVVYHEDERHGILQSRIIFEKGFDNVYLLSGGICIFEKEFPELIVGVQTPLSQRTPRPMTAVSRRVTAAGEMTSMGHGSPARAPTTVLNGATTQYQSMGNLGSTGRSFNGYRVGGGQMR